MRVLILDDNLLWSVRLSNGIRSLGHDATQDLRDGPFDLAIVNLSSPTCCSQETLSSLKASGATVVGHAGHKETSLLDQGRQAGCDHVVSNGTLAHRLGTVLELARPPGPDAPSRA